MKIKFNKRRLIRWGVGFLVLFMFNILVESVLLPVLGIDHTDKNDIYFKLWWALVVIWLVLGLPLLKLNELRRN